MIRPLLIAAAMAAAAAPASAQAPAPSTCSRDAGKGVIAPLLTSCGWGPTLLTINGRRLANDPTALTNGPAVVAPRGQIMIQPAPPKVGLVGTRDLLFRDTDPQPRFDQEPARPETSVLTNEPNVRPENRGGFQLIQKASATDDTLPAEVKEGGE